LPDFFTVYQIGC